MPVDVRRINHVAMARLDDGRELMRRSSVMDVTKARVARKRWNRSGLCIVNACSSIATPTRLTTLDNIVKMDPRQSFRMAS